MCEHPFYHKEYKTWFDCGNCPYCRRKRAQSWSLRNVHEKITTKQETVFVTLTYDRENCPKDYSLNYIDFQNYMKKLRKKLDYPIRFFMSGEYGGKRQRPHYHALIYGIAYKDIPQTDKCWGKGNVMIGYNISHATAAYVAGYIHKKQKAVHYGTRKPPFLRTSLGIGKEYILNPANYTRIFRDGYCLLATTRCRFAIPRYYFKKLGINRTEYYREHIKLRQEDLLLRLQRALPMDPIFIGLEKTTNPHYSKKFDYSNVKPVTFLGYDCYLSIQAAHQLQLMRRTFNDTIRAKQREMERKDL